MNNGIEEESDMAVDYLYVFDGLTYQVVLKLKGVLTNVKVFC